MIKWSLVRGNKHQLRTKHAQNESTNVISSEVDSSFSSHNDETNAPYHDIAGTAELQGPAQDLFSDIIDLEMTDASATTTEQNAVRDHHDSLEINDDEEGQNAYQHVGVCTNSRPVDRLDRFSGRSHEAAVSIPSVVNHSCDYDSSFGPTLAPIHESLEELSIGLRKPRPIEPPVDCGPPPLMPWEGSQKSVGNSSYGEHSSGQFRHTTGMASGPPTPSDASVGTSILAASLSSIPAPAERFFMPKEPKHFFSFGRVFAVAQRPSASASSACASFCGAAEVHFQGSHLVENALYLFIVVQPQGTHAWCIPISTYNGQGLTAPGLLRSAKKSHAILYDDSTQPRGLRDEPRMKKTSIGVSVQGVHDLVTSASRVDFGTVRKVGFKVWLCNVGQVNSASLPYLRSYALESLRNRIEVAP